MNGTGDHNPTTHIAERATGYSRGNKPLRPTWGLLDGPAEAIERGRALFRYLHMTVGTKPGD